jgi:4-amino-4-deoxy-L-arabinose transferase-like glycosyltransferase
VFLTLIYLLTRLINLTLLPVFTDESNYLNWGWITTHFDAFYPLVDGKQPGLMWLFGIFQAIFSDPLWAGRFVSVLFGIANVYLLFLLSRRLINRKAAIITPLLYILTPLFLFYDRQALMESSLITISLASFYFLLNLTDRPSLKSTLLVFLLLGIGFWIKSTPLIFLVTSIVCICIIASFNRSKLPLYLSHLLLGLTYFFLIISPLFFQPEFISTWHRNSDYTLNLSQMLKFPFHTWLATFTTNLTLWFLLLTPAIFLVFLISIPFFIKSPLPRLTKILTLAWIFIPLTLYLLSAKFSGSLFQRYTTPFLPLILIPSAALFSRYSKTLIILLIPATISFIQIQNPPNYFRLLSHFTKYSYIEGYVTGFDTGYQVNAIMTYLKSRTESGPIMVGLQLLNFNPTAGVYIYSRKNPLLKPVYIDPTASEYEQYDCLTTPLPLYFVYVSKNLNQSLRFFKPVTIITNPFDIEAETIYSLRSDCPASQTAQLSFIER